MKKLLLLLIAGVIGLGAYTGYISFTGTPALAGFSPVGGTTYRLQSSIGLSNTTLTLSSFKNRSGIPLTMALMNTDIGYATIDPQSSNSEFISFTGVTQNSNGTATLTGLSRGLSDIYPFTASSTLQQPHAGQAVFILGDSPSFFNEYTIKRNNESITGQWTFFSTSTPHYYVNPTAAAWTALASTTLASKGYVDDQVTAGCANASNTTRGCVEIATAIEAASSTQLGSTGAYLVIPSEIATSSNDVVGLHSVMTQNNGTIKWNLIDLSTNFTVTALPTFAGGILTTASSTMNATTSIAASSVTNNALILNGLAYAFPSVRCSNGQVMQDNGSGVLSCVTLPHPWAFATTSSSGAIGNATATSTGFFGVPANIMTASTTIHFTGVFICNNSANGDGACTVALRNTAGAILASMSVTSDNANTNRYGFTADVVASSLTAQKSVGFTVNYGSFLSAADIGGTAIADTSAINLANSLDFAVTAQSTSANTPITLSEYSIVVNP